MRGQRHERHAEDEKSLVNKGSIGDECVKHRGIRLPAATRLSGRREVMTRRCDGGNEAGFRNSILITLITSIHLEVLSSPGHSVLSLRALILLSFPPTLDISLSVQASHFSTGAEGSSLFVIRKAKLMFTAFCCSSCY